MTKKITGKTVRKLYRLCKELEEANGVRVLWGCFPIEGRIAFYFYLKTRDGSDAGAWMDFLKTVPAYSSGDALRDFYFNFANLLSFECFSDEEIQRYGMKTLADYVPGRFKRRIYSSPGRHAKMVHNLGKRHYCLESLTAPAPAGKQEGCR